MFKRIMKVYTKPRKNLHKIKNEYNTHIKADKLDLGTYIMTKTLITAITHVRKDDAFLDKWINYYAPICGRENLVVLLDGDDWKTSVNLTGIQTILDLDVPRDRKLRNRYLPRVISRHCNQLLQKSDYVLRTDADEFLVLDPAKNQTWREALAEVDKTGILYATGIDVYHDPERYARLDPSLPFLGQRQTGIASVMYSKPVLMSARNRFAGGFHRVKTRRVRTSSSFYLFHLALADFDFAIARLDGRAGLESDRDDQMRMKQRLQRVSERNKNNTFVDFDAAAETMRKAMENGWLGFRPFKPRPYPNGEPTIQIPRRFYGSV